MATGAVTNAQLLHAITTDFAITMFMMTAFFIVICIGLYILMHDIGKIERHLAGEKSQHNPGAKTGGRRETSC